MTHLKTEGHDVQGHLVVAHDGHATIQLKDKQGIWLVVVMPSTTYSGQPDSYQPHDTMMLFVLEKDIDDQARASELQQYQRLQDVLAAIIDYIGEQQAEGCSPWNDFDPSSIEIDPEYREFGGFNGWSMTLSY
ncbi:MAG TPA: hypothetical protein VNQ80_12235 [Parapedobacter sp.]|uniref:hypothetical protein n=1 Tax=Parapedobacter sp. TaxID=1958893 RepID=UPI002BB4F0A1|nr:hypothetical protein [Parapedobacter sp.]HWK58105.1 hypothetical protein [Parapedobacter sp.]